MKIACNIPKSGSRDSGARDISSRSVNLETTTVSSTLVIVGTDLAGPKEIVSIEPSLMRQI
jgi:hypothetical protein